MQSKYRDKVVFETDLSRSLSWAGAQAKESRSGFRCLERLRSSALLFEPLALLIRELLEEDRPTAGFGRGSGRMWGLEIQGPAFVFSCCLAAGRSALRRNFFEALTNKSAEIGHVWLESSLRRLLIHRQGPRLSKAPRILARAGCEVSKSQIAAIR